MLSAKSIIILATMTIAAYADHSFTLRNNCGSAVNVNIDNRSGPPYTGSQPPTIGGHFSWSTTIPNDWNGRICDKRNCYGGGSKTEFYLDDAGNSYYDISNVEGFSVGQQIQAQGGETVTCPSVLCDCTQAYAPGNIAGTCPGSSTPNRPVRVTGTGNAAFTIVYCP